MYYDETDSTKYLCIGTGQITYKKIYYSSGTSCTPIYDELDTCTPCYYETTNYDILNVFVDDDIFTRPRYRPPRAVIKSITPRKKFLIPTRTIRIGREKYPSGKNFCKSPSRSCRQLKIRI